MKLYYLPGACSLASHILLREAGIPFELVRVHTETKEVEDAGDYLAINPLGYVPALTTPNVGTLIENGAILPYLADRFGFAGPGNRYSFLQSISFLSSELLKAYSPFFSDAEMSGDPREKAVVKLHTRLSRLDTAYAFPRFDAATVYAFVITSWSDAVGVSLDAYSNIQAMRAIIAERPSVQEAMAAEQPK